MNRTTAVALALSLIGGAVPAQTPGQRSLPPAQPGMSSEMPAGTQSSLRRCNAMPGDEKEKCLSSLRTDQMGAETGAAGGMSESSTNDRADKTRGSPDTTSGFRTE